MGAGAEQMEASGYTTDYFGPILLSFGPTSLRPQNDLFTSPEWVMIKMAVKGPLNFGGWID